MQLPKSGAVSPCCAYPGFFAEFSRNNGSVRIKRAQGSVRTLLEVVCRSFSTGQVSCEARSCLLSCQNYAMRYRNNHRLTTIFNKWVQRRSFCGGRRNERLCAAHWSNSCLSCSIVSEASHSDFDVGEASKPLNARSPVSTKALKLISNILNAFSRVMLAGVLRSLCPISTYCS